jgi:hypothetical protein
VVEADGPVRLLDVQRVDHRVDEVEQALPGGLDGDRGVTGGVSRRGHQRHPRGDRRLALVAGEPVGERPEVRRRGRPHHLGELPGESDPAQIRFGQPVVVLGRRDVVVGRAEDGLAVGGQPADVVRVGVGQHEVVDVAGLDPDPRQHVEELPRRRCGVARAGVDEHRPPAGLDEQTEIRQGRSLPAVRVDPGRPQGLVPGRRRRRGEQQFRRVRVVEAPVDQHGTGRLADREPVRPRRRCVNVHHGWTDAGDGEKRTQGPAARLVSPR